MVDFNNNEQQNEKRDLGSAPGSGKPSRLLVVLAAADYGIYWILVFCFPEIMLAVSFLLVFLVLYLRRNPVLIAECLENLNLDSPGAEWIGRWLSSWVVTVILGCAFSLILVI